MSATTVDANKPRPDEVRRRALKVSPVGAGKIQGGDGGPAGHDPRNLREVIKRGLGPNK